ncbi:hypothetical protein CCHR01_13090 [Colletotrichum chrysophilum]|uniref:Uncharacterized protein n=1 Tax=Colletotrichum chrysophilum TaxID=1836956 RepID=A0AAD9AAL2_9PEZI|nr:hypothetical protein K456DRAFT_1008159 [Colletotrichum gloeosporioides 23]KAK1844284.1 hypothetical protein CCHR01_13090 [Colletotrichum chrysophilum]
MAPERYYVPSPVYSAGADDVAKRSRIRRNDCRSRGWLWIGHYCKTSLATSTWRDWARCGQHPCSPRRGGEVVRQAVSVVLVLCLVVAVRPRVVQLMRKRGVVEYGAKRCETGT